jgi:hypothetical protein
MFIHTCPCGGDLYLIGFKGSCRIPIDADGFDLGAGPCDTEDELVECGTCRKQSALEYVDADDRCAVCNDPFRAGGPASRSRVVPTLCMFCYTDGDNTE